MPKEAHTKAAEHHENAAKSHKAAAEHHGKGDHEKGREGYGKAQTHSKAAREHSETAHGRVNRRSKVRPNRGAGESVRPYSSLAGASPCRVAAPCHWTSAPLARQRPNYRAHGRRDIGRRQDRDCRSPGAPDQIKLARSTAPDGTVSLPRPAPKPGSVGKPQTRPRWVISSALRTGA